MEFDEIILAKQTPTKPRYYGVVLDNTQGSFKYYGYILDRNETYQRPAWFEYVCSGDTLFFTKRELKRLVKAKNAVKSIENNVRAVVE